MLSPVAARHIKLDHHQILNQVIDNNSIIGNETYLTDGRARKNGTTFLRTQ
jgi:hypothetical protein